jgi:hypothetical protein
MEAPLDGDSLRVLLGGFLVMLSQQDTARNVMLYGCPDRPPATLLAIYAEMYGP